jgi:hypothetical protein
MVSPTPCDKNEGIVIFRGMLPHQLDASTRAPKGEGLEHPQLISLPLRAWPRGPLIANSCDEWGTGVIFWFDT